MSRIWWCLGLTGVLLVAAGLTLARSSAAESRPAVHSWHPAGTGWRAPLADRGWADPGDRRDPRGPGGHGPAPTVHGPVPGGHGPVPGERGPVPGGRGPGSDAHGPGLGGGPALPPVGGILPNVGSFAPPLPHGKVAVTAAPVHLRYTFDGGIRQPITDTGGGHELQPLGQNGGRLRLVPQGSGFAVAYPRRCALPEERDCPRAILQGLRDDSLNPGTRPLEYGASVLMNRSDLADGANVVQKGYSVGGGSQYKLQVDHLLGHPSCVIAGQRHWIYRAEPWIDVADGRWHRLVCTRTTDRLTLTVDGLERASVPVPPGLSIANPEPLRVGGKGPARGNDQFAGQIDDVFVTIS